MCRYCNRFRLISAVVFHMITDRRFVQLFICLSAHHTRTGCKTATFSYDYAHRGCCSVTACLKFFFPFSVQRVQSSIICPRCQKWCHNMIMRLHTFGGDSCGKTWPVGSDGTNSKAWNEYQSFLQSGRRGSGARTAETTKPLRTHGLLRTEKPDQRVHRVPPCSSFLVWLFIGESKLYSHSSFYFLGALNNLKGYYCHRDILMKGRCF